MELKSEVDAIGINLARNLINTFRASHNTIRKVIHDAQEITDHKKIIIFFRSIRSFLREDC